MQIINRHNPLAKNHHQTDNKPIETTGDKTMKKYQVLETTDGEFGVFNMETVKELGDDAKSLFKFEYAAEAQERADELNEG